MKFAAALLISICVLAARDAREIVRDSVERDRRNRELAHEYTFEVRDRRTIDGKAEVKTYEVTYLYGREFRRLIAKDDKPLSPADREKERRRFDKEVAKRAALSPGKLAANAEKEKKRREELREVLLEVPDAFDFQLLGEETVGGLKAWKIAATPHPGYRAKHSDAKNFRKMKGTLWIDPATGEWVKVDAETIEPFSFGLFLAHLSPGSHLEFEQMRVNGEIWMAKQAAVRVAGRIVFKKFGMEQVQTFSHYRKFRTDVRIVPGGIAAGGATLNR